jgi:hypothetical protein
MEKNRNRRRQPFLNVKLLIIIFFTIDFVLFVAAPGAESHEFKDMRFYGKAGFCGYFFLSSSSFGSSQGKLMTIPQFEQSRW